MAVNLEKQMIGAITFIPGLVGLSNIDFSKKPTILKEENWAKGISVEKGTKGTIVKVATIVSIDIRAKIISDEITGAVKNIFKKNKQKLERVVVYIRGVK